ncbi:MAG: glycoside hydrolase family 3 protein [Kiritimatiellales bacterium]
MSLREQMGQLLMIDIRQWGADAEGNPVEFIEMNEDVATLIAGLQPGGVILFRENLIDTEQTVRLTEGLQHAGAKLPLFIGVDQEGGYITRLRYGTEMPGNLALGAAGEAEFVEQANDVMGRELRVLGINFNFSPVVDLYSGTDKPVINIRSYGDNPETIGRFAAAAIQGLHSQEIITAAKHFPGHGHTTADSHSGLVTADCDQYRWKRIDRVPFAMAITAGTDAIMTAHIVVPSLDDAKLVSRKDGRRIGTPATLSKPILTGILRNEMGFKGLIVTDALGMKAVSEHVEPTQAVVLSILAGSDVILMPISIKGPKEVESLQILMDEVVLEAGHNPELSRRITESAGRIVVLKQKKLMNRPAVSVDEARQIVGCPAHKKMEKQLAERAVTVIRNDGVLPLSLESSRHILLITETDARNRIMSDEIGKLSKAAGVTGVTIQAVKVCFEDPVSPELKTQLRSADCILVATYNLNRRATLPNAIAALANQLGKQLVTISTHNPYDIACIPAAKANIAIYGITGYDVNTKRNAFECNIRAGVRTIFFSASKPELFNSPCGTLPVTIKDQSDKVLYPSGHGLTY